MANPYFVEPASPLQALMTGVQGYEGADKRAKQAEKEAALREAGQLYASGNQQGAIARLMSAHPELGVSMINQQTQRAHQTAVLGEQSRHNRATEGIAQSGVSGNRVPPGWAEGPAGDLTPRVGGPADPTYLESVAQAKAKPKEFNVSDITKLSEEGGKLGNLRTFADTFEPRFGGFYSHGIGGAATAAGRYLPEKMVGKDLTEGASWWQGYDKYKNVVRNELFGSALTPSEQAAFEKADVNPGMTPDQVQKNLILQKDIVSNGLKRKANALIQAGYDPAVISAAYGLDLKEIGVKDQGRVSAGSRRAAPSTEAGGSMLGNGEVIVGGGELKIGLVEGGYRYKGGDPNNKENWVKVK